MLDLELLELCVNSIENYVGDTIEIVGWSNEVIILSNRGIVREIPFALLENALDEDPYLFDYYVMKEFGILDRALELNNEYILGLVETLENHNIY